MRHTGFTSENNYNQTHNKELNIQLLSLMTQKCDRISVTTLQRKNRMTQVVVRKEPGNVIQKIADVAKPGYVKEAYNTLEPLQKSNGDIIQSGSKWAVVEKRRIRRSFLRFFATSAVIAPSITSILLLDPTDPVPLGIALASSLVSTGATGFFQLIFHDHTQQKALDKVKDMYREDVKAWLYDKYKIITNKENLEEIVAKVVQADTSDYLLPDVNSGHLFTLKTDPEHNTWTVVKVNSQPVASVTQLEPLDRIENLRISDAFNTVNKKIATLQQFTLTSEDDYLFAKAVNDTHATVNLANQLEQLGDTAYADKAEQAFKLIEADLDAIIENQKKEISGQFRTQHNTILSRV